MAKRVPGRSQGRQSARPQYLEGHKASSGDKGDHTDNALTQQNGILYRRGWLWVPKGLVPEILKSEHDSKIAGHFGQDKTIELIRRHPRC